MVGIIKSELSYWATEQDYRIKCYGCQTRWHKMSLLFCESCGRFYCASCWEEHDCGE